MPDGRPGFLEPGHGGQGVGPTRSGATLRQLVAGLRDGWRIVAGATLLAVVLAVLALRVHPPEYTASMRVGPTARTGAAAMGPRLPVLGREPAHGMAEPGAGDESLSDFARYLELLVSTPVAQRLMADPLLVRRLFPECWDEEAQEWRPASGVLPAVKRLLLAVVGREDWAEPDAERVARALADRLAVETVRTGPMRRLALRHSDRVFAVDLLGRVAAATDAHLRAEAARRSAAQIAYVKEHLSGLTMAEHRRALADLLSEQERVSMMIEVDLPFAADVIEPAFAAQRPDWPNPAMVLPAAGLFGFVAGVFAVSLRGAWRAP